MKIVKKKKHKYFKMKSTAFITATQERDAIGTRMISRSYQGGNPMRNTTSPSLEGLEWGIYPGQ